MLDPKLFTNTPPNLPEEDALLLETITTVQMFE